MSSPMSDALTPDLDRLAGLVERVTFHNEQNGFCVLRLKVKGERELITLIGHAPTVSPGEYASASGAPANFGSYFFDSRSY
jgi:exodeoxyribonuclease V alpha subunit